MISRNSMLLAGMVLATCLLVGFFYWTSLKDSGAPSFGGVSLSLEYADTEALRELGLGGREAIASDYGMLFIFPKPDRYGFWMKDMLMPIDIFWLDDKGQVVWIAEQVATSTYPSSFYPPVPALYVLETQAGFAATNAIATGTPLKLKNFSSVSK